MIEQAVEMFITPLKPWEEVGELQRDALVKKHADEATEREGSRFSDILKTMTQRVYDTNAEVGKKQYLLATGQLDDAHSLPIAQAKASISIEMLVTLRNKALESYNDLLKMNI